MASLRVELSWSIFLAMSCWKSLLLVYKEIDVSFLDRNGESVRFSHELPEKEVKDAMDSFADFPELVSELTDRRASIDYEVVRCERPLGPLTEWRSGFRWPAPGDVRLELDGHAPVGAFDSIFILWPQRDIQRQRMIESGGWGLGMAASASSNGATYAAVGNAESWTWEVPRTGEVWLHEWLHGVCAFYRAKGFAMPDGDADGGDRHGYTQSPETGWTGYYRDLMTGCVIDGGVPTGIPLDAWRIPPSYRVVS